ncbi:hypothetical protein [uncultured Adlercreutzia sp.]|uniref:hypothetical protein n=1 Tax=uncultured Adlercreutzia sp. TaxID=875803 RepID=UPI0026F3B434|nr:hypothetical protein [uncultured Adlercreutzia sp.]
MEEYGRKRREGLTMAVGALMLSVGLGLGAGTLAWAGTGGTGGGSTDRPPKAWGTGAVAGPLNGAAAKGHEARAALERGAYTAAMAQARAGTQGESEKEGAHPTPPHDDEAPDASGKGEADAVSDTRAAKVEGGSSNHTEDQGSTGHPDGPPAAKADTGAAGDPAPSPSGGGGRENSGTSHEAEPDRAPAEGAHEPAALAPCTLVIGGEAIPYRDVRGGTTPGTGGGLWLGSDAVSDGSWGYFVGHNPGSFAPVQGLRTGSIVTVCDSAGAQRTYTVCDRFSVEASATWKTIASRVTGYGESVVLQTCNDDGATNTIVVAA